MKLHAVLISIGLASIPAGVSLAQGSDYDFDFVTVGAAGNAGYNRSDPNGFVTGYGSVPYSYRIGRTEVTTAQWMEFVNVASTHEWNLQLRFGPNYWGAAYDPTYTGPGFRYRLSAGAPD